MKHNYNNHRKLYHYHSLHQHNLGLDIRKNLYVKDHQEVMQKIVSYKKYFIL